MTYRKYLRPTLSSLLALSLAAPSFASPSHVVREPAQTAKDQDSDYRNALAQHMRNVRDANEVQYTWLWEERANVNAYNQLRGQEGGPNKDFDLYTDAPKVYVRPPTLKEMKESKETYDLATEYYGHQGLQRLLGAFIESGSSYADGEEWNTQRWIGLKVKSIYQKLFKKAKEKDIRNIRFGINIHELDIRRYTDENGKERIYVKPDSIQHWVDLCRENWKNGISPTISVLFFPSLKQWEVKNADGSVNPMNSYLNNPKFAGEIEQISEAVLKEIFKAADDFNAKNSQLAKDQQLPEARVAIGPVNEDETLAGFTGQFWAGAFAKWGDPNAFRLYVPAVINIAESSVRIRMATERASGGRRVLFFHNEAMTPKDYPSHKGDGQFAASKLILGDDDLMNADYKKLATEPLEQMQARFEANKKNGKLNVVEWCILAASNIPANDTQAAREATRTRIVQKLEALKNLHLEYTRQTQKTVGGKVVKEGKTAKTDTILMLDYYQQSEFILPKSVPEMVKDFSANQGELLKKIINVSDDQGFLNVLEEAAHTAEQLTGQKFWDGYKSRSEIDFTKLLTQEDGLILDKLIGLRNEWGAINEPVYVARRKAVGISEDMGNFNDTDEKRSDNLLRNLLANDAQLLKSALNVSTDAQLLEVLKTTGLDTRHGGPQVVIKGNETLREILNKSERTVLHRLFGLERHRRTGFLPPHYARQTRAAMRMGIYETFILYVNELGIRVGGIGESGTPYYPWAALVHKQMIYSVMAAARRCYFYFLRYDFGPLVGTIGWMNGPLIGSIKTNARRATDGIMKLVRLGKNVFDFEMSAWPGSKPWFEEFTRDFYDGMKRAEAKVLARKAAAAKDKEKEKSEKKETDVVKLAEKVKARPQVQCSKFRIGS